VSDWLGNGHLGIAGIRERGDTVFFTAVPRGVVGGITEIEIEQ
jgi:hypothetical protein